VRKDPFVTDKYYHVFNRGVDKRKIFSNKSDYYRFLVYLVVFNDETSWPNLTKSLKEALKKSDKRKKIIDIVGYCLMPNHFHLLVKQVAEKGLPIFLQKLGVGYTHYFNKKYERSGVLFQGRSKSVLIQDNNQLLHLSRYIHLNPKEIVESFKSVAKYPWSSCQFFVSGKASSILSGTEVIKDQFETQADYLDFLKAYREEVDRGQINDLILE